MSPDIPERTHFPLMWRGTFVFGRRHQRRPTIVIILVRVGQLFEDGQDLLVGGSILDGVAHGDGHRVSRQRGWTEGKQRTCLEGSARRSSLLPDQECCIQPRFPAAPLLIYFMEGGSKHQRPRGLTRAFFSIFVNADGFRWDERREGGRHDVHNALVVRQPAGHREMSLVHTAPLRRRGRRKRAHLMHFSRTSLTNLGLGISRSTARQSDLEKTTNDHQMDKK